MCVLGKTKAPTIRILHMNPMPHVLSRSPFRKRYSNTNLCHNNIPSAVDGDQEEDDDDEEW